jgi:nucleotide-binding universal stress UspA family protein
MTPSDTATARKPFAPPAARSGPAIVALGGGGVPGVLRVARYVASSSGAGVLAVSVVEPFPAYFGGEVALLHPEFETERAAGLLAELNEQVHSVATAGSEWRTEVLYGEPSHAISELSRARHSPLIVMGLGRHSPLDRLLGDETTLRTIRSASCPVLAVSPDARAPYREAVVATDFSPSSAKAAESIIPLLTDGSVLHLVHVWQPSTVDDARLRALDEAYTRSLPDRFRHFREILNVPSGVTLKEEVREGKAAERVLDYAKAHHADVIVAGRQGRTLLARLVVGSVTTALLRGATCSVLVSHEPAFADLDRFRRLLTGTSESHKPEEWVQQLDGFTRRNRGRRTAVEVDDISFGAQVFESGYAFQGATYDQHDRRIELMLGEGEPNEPHVTRGIANVDSVAIATDRHGKDSGLRISHGPGQTVLTFSSD